MKQIYSLIALSIYLLISSSPASATDHSADLPSISKEEYKVAKEIALEALKKCPPPECTIVGVGRSPALIISYLQQHSKGSAYNLPLSSFRYVPTNPKEDQTPWKSLKPAMDENTEKKLFKHFDTFLKEKGAITEHTKKIMLLDFAISGESLMSTSDYMEKYLKTQGNAIKLDSMAIIGRRIPFMRFNWKENFQKAANYYQRSPIIHELEQSTFLTKLIGGNYEVLAEYGSYNLESPPDENVIRTPRSEYEQTKGQIKTFIEADCLQQAASQAMH